ncbi:hypothetical protein BJ508DRAFT_410810 [Ascobolus immersus RN42]|uniref:Uncharacterized protein n=1 Tax=Ascobolus immersus RN42 TaxID=1160509 RepID=A0A3N4IRC2_ASCIM|nr:hypothetical protein BJ508DRAFT_410810 [Ascobolus immersus RN42]
MLKGLSTLGLLGFVKVLFFLGPGAWWNLRGVGRARPGARGRERISTLVLVIGVGTFLWWVWTTVRQWVGDRMGSLRDKVLDIGEGEDEEIYEDERNANTSTGWGNNNTTPMNGTDGFREQDGDSIGVDGEPVVQEDAPQQEEVLLGEGQEDEHEFLRRRERMGTSDRAEEHVY